jgi:CRISPR-associated protein Cas2
VQVELLVTYDVATDTAEGRRRLRRVAKLCEGHGQRVQLSVFECILNPAELEVFIHRLEKEIDVEEDSLRIYRLREPFKSHVRVLGRTVEHDLHDPLVL